MDNAIRGLTDGVRRFGDIVASHHTQIANFFKAFKAGSAAQAKLFAAVFVDLSKVMLPVLDTMARFPKTSAALITSFLLASRAVKTLQAGVKGLETIKTVSGVIGTFGQKIKSIPSRKVTKIQVDGAKSTRDLQSYSNRLERIPKTKRTVVSASTTQANRNLGAVQRQAQRVPRAISVRATANTTQAVTNIARVGTTSQTAATLSRTSFTLIGTSAKIASTGLSLIGGPAGAIMLVIQGFQLLYQHSAKFRKFVDGIANAAKSMAGKVGRWFGNMASSAGKHINRMAQSAKRGWNNMNRTSQQSSQREIRLHNQMAQRNQRAAQQMWSRLSRSWIQGWNLNNRLTRQGVQQQIQQHRTMSTRIAVFNTQLWNRSRQAFTKGWNDLRNSTRNGTNNINDEFNRMKVAVGQRAQQAMNDAKNHFQRGYSDIKSNTSGWRGDMANIWSDTRGKIGNIADNLRGDATNKFSDMHSKLNDLTNGGLGKMEDAWHNRLEGIAEVVTNSGGHIFNQFKNVLNNLAKPFESLINGIKDGVNWILDHVGGDGKLGSFSFPGFANGTNGPIEKDQLALLNDAPGSHYQEMVHRASTGETFMLPAKRNMLFPLQKGDEVLDGERSHQLATMIQMPIPHANGAIGDFFSGLWNGAKELEDIAEDALKNVVGFGKSLFTHFVANVTPKSTDSLNGGLKLNLPGFYAEHLKNWMKKQLEQMEDDNSGSVTAEMIKKAAAKMKVSVSAGDISHILNVVQHESGGNARAINNWDINAQEGHPSKGVLQFIDGTFNKYAVKGHHDIWKPFDQILAMFNDSTWRSDLTLGGWGPSGAPRGFANGGIATTPSIFGEAGAEMAIPLDTMKSTRAWQLMKQVVDYYAGSSNQSAQVVNQTDLTPLEKRFDAALAQNQQLINLIEQLIGVTDSANNPTARYRRTQRDINLAQAQSLTGI